MKKNNTFVISSAILKRITILVYKKQVGHDIKTKLTPEQQKAIIKQTNKMFDGGKIVPGQGGKFMLYVPFGGDYANAVGILKKLGIKM